MTTGDMEEVIVEVPIWDLHALTAVCRQPELGEHSPHFAKSSLLHIRDELTVGVYSPSIVALT